MDNAVKYRRQDVPPGLLVRTWNENGKLHISVKDNGIGIKKEYLKKVFDRFFRVRTGNKHDVKGFGLLAYEKIIEDQGIQSNILQGNNNIGTKFIITLPSYKKLVMEENENLLCEDDGKLGNASERVSAGKRICYRSFLRWRSRI